MIKNQKGIAMLVALTSVVIMTFLAVEVGYNTQLELMIGASQLDRLKAYYLAKSGVSVSLLRIKVYKMAIQKYGSMLGKDRALLDMIWSIPTMWPPVIPKEFGLVSKEELDKSIKQSLIQGSFNAIIEGEGNKIDLIDLASPVKSLQESTAKQLIQLIKNRLEQDDAWARENRNIRPEEIVNNIADWIDEDTIGRSSGDENGQYSSTEARPSNRPLKTLKELHQVKGVTEEIYNLLAPQVTLYGIKGINVNTASADILRSIDPQITEEIAAKIIERRNNPDYGPFTNSDDFLGFIKPQGVNGESFNKDPTIPLYFESEFNFRIKSTGIVAKSQREIFAIVYDFAKVKVQLTSAIPVQEPAAPQPGQPAASPTPPSQPAPAPTPPAQSKGAPPVVFWQEN